MRTTQLIGCLLLVFAGHARAEQVITVICHELLGPDKPLTVRMVERDGEIEAALATAPRFNRAVHEVSVQRADDGGFTFDLTIHPDNYVPEDGQPFALHVTTEGDGETATYAAVRGENAFTGRCTIQTRAVRDHALDRLQLRMEGAVTHIYLQRRSSWKYALDMNLHLTRQDGEWAPALLESIVPDYRRYSAAIRENNLTLADHRLRGSLVVDMYDGGQGRAEDDPERIKTYTYRFDGVAIDGAVGGRYSASFGDQTVADLNFLGMLTHRPPPAPDQAIARLRLHRAMGEDWPVLLNLSLTDADRLHGYAWAPGYNHQPHTLDTGGLRREQDRLRGTIKVTICPDIYKEPEIFTLTYRIDAKIEAGMVRGDFTGTNRAGSVSGPITGRLTRKAPPPDEGDLRAVELDLGYSLLRAKTMPADWRDKHPNHARVHITLDEGAIVQTTVAHPAHPDLYPTEVSDATFALNGDELTGSVRFNLQAAGLRDGQYQFTFQGIVNGSSIEGYWRGEHEGEPIYTKSAKLGGRLLTDDDAGPRDTAENE